MAKTQPLGAKAATVPVSGYRHANWRMNGPAPLIVNPEADLAALTAWCWGEARDIEDLTNEFLQASDVTAEALAGMLYARVPGLVSMLSFLAESAHKGEISHV